MWSTLRRLSEASHCSIMCRLWLPAAFGSSSSIAPCTLVASTRESRLPLRCSAFPTDSSLAPLVYTFAVSRKLTPPSMARSMISAESSSLVLSPNIMHPRQISLTFAPVLPRFLYSTFRSFEVVALLFNIPRQRRRIFRGLIPLRRVCSIAACGTGLVRRGREGRRGREEVPVGDTRDGLHCQAIRAGPELRARGRGARRRVPLGSLGGEVRG